MKHLQRVVWSKGMFLTPQHFQAQDEYFEQHILGNAAWVGSASLLTVNCRRSAAMN